MTLRNGRVSSGNKLEGKRNLIEKLKGTSRTGMLTLLYSAKDELHNQAAVLKEFLEDDVEG